MKVFNTIVFKPLICPFRPVFWAIVLLGNPLPLLHLQLFKAFHHSLIQNLTVFYSTHDSLSFYKLSYFILSYTPPYHDVILASCLIVGDVVLFDRPSPFSSQVYTLPSN